MRRRKGLLQLVAAISCTASGIQVLEKIDLWEGPHTPPLQDTGGECVSPSPIPRPMPKPNIIAGVESGLVRISVLFGNKESLPSQDVISKTQPYPLQLRVERWAYRRS